MKLNGITLKLPIGVAAALVCGAVLAQSAPASAPAIGTREEPKVEQLRTSDTGVTIDELRVRGETQKVTVKPKNAPEYEIAPQTAAKRADDRSQGVRTWRIFSF